MNRTEALLEISNQVKETREAWNNNIASSESTIVRLLYLMALILLWFAEKQKGE